MSAHNLQKQLNLFTSISLSLRAKATKIYHKMSDANLEKDLNATCDIFKELHGNMKTTFPVWEDFIQRGQRLQRSLEQLIASFSSFLDGFARLADIATQSKGGTEEMGTSLTDIARWHKAVELKIREINYAFTSKLLTPIGNRLDEWKKSLTTLEKDHDKEMNKALKESKEIQKGTIKAAKNIESKRKKKDKNLTSIMEQFDQMQAENDANIAETEQKEKVHMSRLIVEERVWFSTLGSALKSVLDNEVMLSSDLERLPELICDLNKTSSTPSILPEDMKNFIEHWEIPSVHVSRARAGSQLASLKHRATSSEDLNISSPVNNLGYTVPSLAQSEVPVNCTNNSSNVPPPTVPAPVPPPVPQQQSGIYRYQHPEELYDVPVPSASVSVSPSQVSLSSNASSHHSAESNHSSTRSASPPYSHLAPQQRPSHDPYSTYQQPTSYLQSSSTSPFPHSITPFVNPSYPSVHPSYPPVNPSYSPNVSPYPTIGQTRRTYETDIEIPTQIKNPNNVESNRYIPATLPRPPKKPTNSPNRNNPHGRDYRQKPNVVPRQTSAVQLSTHTDVSVDDDDTNSSSAFAQALRQKQLRKTNTMIQ